MLRTTQIFLRAYRFDVLATNNDGVWSTTPATFSFQLQPYFTQTYWFYLICAALILLLVWLVYRWRVHQVESRFRAVLAERTRIAREIHDTLAQGFVGISVQLELPRRCSPLPASRSRTAEPDPQTGPRQPVGRREAPSGT